MTRRLLAITDWDERAGKANYCVTTLAGLCDVSVSTLRRHIQTTFKMASHQWLHELRMKRAVELLMDDTSVKETSILLGYRHTSHFTKDFRQHHGHPPGEHVQLVLKATAQPK